MLELGKLFLHAAYISQEIAQMHNRLCRAVILQDPHTMQRVALVLL